MLEDGWSGPTDRSRIELPERIEIAARRANADPDDYYAIADDLDIVQSGRSGLVTLDCVSVRHFWRTLLAHRRLFQVLENYYNAATAVEIENRRELLTALLRVEDDDLLAWIRIRCAVLMFFPPDSLAEMRRRFPSGRWRRISIMPDGPPSLLTVPAQLEGVVAVATRDLHDDETVSVTIPKDGGVSLAERRYLEEIFSLNHIRDKPLDGGLTPLVPAPGAPIILSHGGFAIDGEEDFWRGHGGDAISVPDENISRYPVRGRAYCRPLKCDFEVVPGSEWALAGDYTVTLRDAYGPRFIIGIEGEQLTVWRPKAPPKEALFVEREQRAAVQHAYQQQSKTLMRG